MNNYEISLQSEFFTRAVGKSRLVAKHNFAFSLSLSFSTFPLVVSCRLSVQVSTLTSKVYNSVYIHSSKVITFFFGRRRSADFYKRIIIFPTAEKKNSPSFFPTLVVCSHFRFEKKNLFSTPSGAKNRREFTAPTTSSSSSFRALNPRGWTSAVHS